MKISNPLILCSIAYAIAYSRLNTEILPSNESDPNLDPISANLTIAYTNDTHSCAARQTCDGTSLEDALPLQWAKPLISLDSNNYSVDSHGISDVSVSQLIFNFVSDYAELLLILFACVVLLVTNVKVSRVLLAGKKVTEEWDKLCCKQSNPAPTDTPQQAQQPLAMQQQNNSGNQQASPILHTPTMPSPFTFPAPNAMLPTPHATSTTPEQPTKPFDSALVSATHEHKYSESDCCADNSFTAKERAVIAAQQRMNVAAAKQRISDRDGDGNDNGVANKHILREYQKSKNIFSKNWCGEFKEMSDMPTHITGSDADDCGYVEDEEAMMDAIEKIVDADVICSEEQVKFDRKRLAEIEYGCLSMLMSDSD